MNQQLLKKVLIVLAFIILVWVTLIRNVDLPAYLTVKENLVKEKLVEFVNEAQFSDKWKADGIDDKGKFHLVTNIVLVTHKSFSDNLLFEGGPPPTMNQLTERQQEIERCLQTDLNNPKVATIHIVYSHPDVLSYLRKLKMENTKKMVLHFSDRDATVGINLRYIQNRLKNKYVFLKHQDNFLGEGWEDIDFGLIRKNNLVYALTRHAISKTNLSCSPSQSCHEGTQYIGSHDAFVFYSEKSFPEAMLKEMDIVPSSAGMENLMIWYFRDVMKYKVTNPCKKLKVYHVHCVSIREKGRKRYNNNGKSGTAGFTNDLS